MISAIIQTDDFIHVHQIDATPFFEQASDYDIEELLRCETDHYARVWHGRKKAYGGRPESATIIVSFFKFMLNRNKSLEIIEVYQSKTGIGGVIFFLASDLEKWIEANRPHLLQV